jgi:hypothetical protein
MASKKIISIKKSRQVKRNKTKQTKKPIVKDDQRTYINKWDKEQQEWARTFNHEK